MRLKIQESVALNPGGLQRLRSGWLKIDVLSVVLGGFTQRTVKDMWSYQLEMCCRNVECMFMNASRLGDRSLVLWRCVWVGFGWRSQIVRWNGVSGHHWDLLRPPWICGREDMTKVMELLCCVHSWIEVNVCLVTHPNVARTLYNGKSWYKFQISCIFHMFQEFLHRNNAAI